MNKLNDQLQTFLTNKVEPKLEKNKIKKEHLRVREILTEELGDDLVDHFLMGSYIRNTLTKRLNKDDKYDVDVMLVFNEQKYSQADLPFLLDKTMEVAEIIKKNIHEIEKVRPQKVSVGLIYRDNFKIDLVPAIAHGSESFKIFDSRNQNTVISNPRKHNEDLTAANEDNNNLLVPLIKLVKRWKDEQEEDTFKSFHLERLAIQLFQEQKVEDYLHGLSVYFNNAYTVTIESHPVKDSVNPENNISSYLDDEGIRILAAEAFAKAAESCDEAISQEESGNMKGAKRALGRLFEHFQSEEDSKVATAIASNFSPKPSPHLNHE